MVGQNKASVKRLQDIKRHINQWEYIKNYYYVSVIRSIYLNLFFISLKPAL